MKKSILALFVAMMAYGCSTDVNLTTSWKDITVVYGMLSPTESVHYVRVEKAYLSANENALLTALNTDSLYYPESAISVKIQKLAVNAFGDTTVAAEYPMTRVDANLEPASEYFSGEVDTNTVFSTNPKWVYKSTATLEANKAYRIRVDKADGSPSVTADFKMLGNVSFTAPLPNNDLNWQLNSDIPFIWDKVVGAVLYDLTLNVRYCESTDNFVTSEEKSLEWIIRKNETGSGNAGSFIRVDVSPVSFFSFMANSLTTSAADTRRISTTDMVLDAAGEDYLKYVQSYYANQGLSGGFSPINLYSNVKNGIGLVSSRVRHVEYNYNLSDAAITKLRSNPVTANLGFGSVACQ